MKTDNSMLNGETGCAEANNKPVEIREDLEAHLDYLAEQNGITRLSDEQAHALSFARITRRLKSIGWDFNQLTEADMRGIIYSDSYSGTSRKTGAKMFYVDPDEHDDPLVRYFVGLHEIGHMTLNHKTDGETCERIIQNEIEADEWALEHSIVEASDEVLVMMQCALATYTDAYESGRWTSTSQMHSPAMTHYEEPRENIWDNGTNDSPNEELIDAEEILFNLAGEQIDNSLTSEGEKRVRALAQSEARKAQQTFEVEGMPQLSKWWQTESCKRAYDRAGKAKAERIAKVRDTFKAKQEKLAKDVEDWDRLTD